MTNVAPPLAPGLLRMREPHDRGSPLLSFKIYHRKSFQTDTKGSDHSDMVVPSQESDVPHTLLEMQGHSWARNFKVLRQLPEVLHPEGNVNWIYGAHYG